MKNIITFTYNRQDRPTPALITHHLILLIYMKANIHFPILFFPTTNNPQSLSPPVCRRWARRSCPRSTAAPTAPCPTWWSSGGRRCPGELWLAGAGHVTRVVTSDWSRHADFLQQQTRYRTDEDKRPGGRPKTQADLFGSCSVMWGHVRSREVTWGHVRSLYAWQRHTIHVTHISVTFWRTRIDLWLSSWHPLQSVSTAATWHVTASWQCVTRLTVSAQKTRLPLLSTASSCASNCIIVIRPL